MDLTLGRESSADDSSASIQSPPPVEQAPGLSPKAVLNTIGTQFLLLLDRARNTPDEFIMTIDGRLVSPLSDQVCEPTRIDAFNQIANSDFADKRLMPWGYRTTKGGFQRNNVDFSPEMTLKPGGTGHVFVAEAQPSVTLEYVGSGIHELLFPVEPEETYCFSGYFATHRVRSQLVLQFHAGAALLETHETAIDPNIPGGNVVEKYVRAAVFGMAPAEATHASIRLEASLQPEQKTGFFFFSRLWFGLAEAPLVPAWSPSFHEIFGIPAEPRPPRTSCVLSFPVPANVLDGTEHQIRLTERGSGNDIAGSPLVVRYAVSLSGAITRIDGLRVSGEVSSESEIQGQMTLELLIDGELANHAQTRGQRKTRAFDLQIPVGFCDGLPHLFAVRLQDTGHILCRMAGVSPISLTPFDSLQTYAGLPIDASLSPQARARFKTLLDRLGSGQPTDQLKVLHDRLLRGPLKQIAYEKLAFPVVEAPVASIVIPVHNKFEMTYFCLCALLFTYNEATFEVIVVDDGSSDETAEMEDIASGVAVVRHDYATGFIRSCNDGAKVARGQYIVFLNNDTEPTSRWLDELIYAFTHFNGVGLAGSKLLYPDGQLQEAGGIVWGNGNPWNYGRRANPVAPATSYTRQADYLSGAAIMLPRTVWDAVGGFSNEFEPAYFEDTDLAFKVRERGLKTLFMPHSIVYHYEGVSAGTSVASGMKRFQEVNRPKFKRKWARAYSQNGVEGIDVELAKDRGIRFRALMLDIDTPRMDNDAGSYAAIQEMRALQALGFKVTFLGNNYAYLGRHTELLQRIGVEVLYAPFTDGIQSLLAKRGKEFDLVFVTRYQVARLVTESVRRYAPQAKLVLDLCDLHFLRELRAAILQNSEGAKTNALRIRDAELEACRSVDMVFSYNDVERGVIFSHNLETGIVSDLPWIAEPRPLAKSFKERRNISFLGGFRHPPNCEAVEFFIDRVLPRLVVDMPDIQFEIFGSSISPESQQKWAGDNVIVRGQVPDISAVFDETRVFVAPLLSGAGVKGKLFDCLSSGVPSVISSMAAEGMGVRDGLETWIAKTPEEWVAKVKLLYADEAKWTAMSKAAHAFIAEKHSFARGVEVIRQGLERVGLFCEPDEKYMVVNTCRP